MLNIKNIILVLMWHLTSTFTSASCIPVLCSYFEWTHLQPYSVVMSYLSLMSHSISLWHEGTGEKLFF